VKLIRNLGDGCGDNGVVQGHAEYGKTESDSDHDELETAGIDSVVDFFFFIVVLFVLGRGDLCCRNRRRR